MSALSSPMRRPFLPLSMPWPAPALLAWLLAWSLWVAVQRFGLSPPWAFALAAAAGLLAAVPIQGRWRRLLVALGFPLSALGTGVSMPAWAWPLAIAPLLLAYPPRAWRDAPFFPTPACALDGLDGSIELAPNARVLDAGCGIGHGLAALRRLWPRAQLHGIEWSRPLTRLAAWRCPWAQLARGDMWALSWRGFDLVYLFQRPESMARAMAKAEAEMAPGAWLVSLEFGVPGRTPTASLQGAARRSVWAYRIGGSDGIATLASTARRKRR